MAQVFVITDSDALMKSLARYFRFVSGEEVCSYSAPCIADSSPHWVTHTFNRIAVWIESNAGPDGDVNHLKRAIAFVSLYDEQITTISDLNPISTNDGTWAAVVAMLVLAFPEVHWVFITAQGPPSKLLRSVQGLTNPLFIRAHFLSPQNRLKQIMELHAAKFSPLFDPTGLRQLIRTQIKKKKDTRSEQLASYIPIRSQVAAAIDEEEAYASFNAYIAYRIGYQTHAVCTYKMMDEVFGDNTWNSYPALLFEDLYLNFPDKLHTIHLSNLAERKTKFPGIDQADVRVFITSGHERHADEVAFDANESHLRRWLLESPPDRRRYTKTLYKPLSGTFDLWKKSGLQRWLRWNKGLAPGYTWPPDEIAKRESEGSHSSPGRLLEIANYLIKRAQKISENAQLVPEAVHGALLVLDAQEYLGNRTPTTSLEALSLKHILEVTAECKFYGVEYNKDIKSRLQEVRREARSIGEWFRRKTRSLSVLDAEVGIVSELVQRFREYNQFDEEYVCLARARKLHRYIWLKKNRAWAWPFYPLRWYVEFLLGSMLVFVAAITVWIAMLSYLFGVFCRCHVLNPEKSAEINIIVHGLGHAITTFFGLQHAHAPSEMEELGYMALIISLLAVLAGFVHLGIFVSHLYSLIVRR